MLSHIGLTGVDALMRPDGLVNSVSRRRLALGRLWWAGGLVCAVTLASLLSWGWPAQMYVWDQVPLGLASVGAYLASIYVAQKVSRFGAPGSDIFFGVMSMFLVYSVFSLVLLFSRVYYSRTFLLTMLFVTVGWFIAERLTRQVRTQPLIAYMPGQISPEMEAETTVRWLKLESPGLGDLEPDAVVVDFDAEDAGWQHLIAECALRDIPAISASQMYEWLFCRVTLDELSHGQGREFHVHGLYAPIKRALDVVLTVMLLPLVLPLMALVAVVIRLDSEGPIFFVQERIGQKGRKFKMYKFRSMYTHPEAVGARFARLGDDRVTRVGRFLRRNRIDELPQLWNVLKGEMSLIGPRPEQVVFVEKFDRLIPFYSYRHLVKPGLTGLAQVSQGYVACVATTRQKLEYDLYYAKHSSPWVDLLILLRTFKVILTGFGAR